MSGVNQPVSVCFIAPTLFFLIYIKDVLATLIDSDYFNSFIIDTFSIFMQIFDTKEVVCNISQVCVTLYTSLIGVKTFFNIMYLISFKKSLFKMHFNLMKMNKKKSFTQGYGFVYKGVGSHMMN